jgi:tRNA pseudouridine55 synthase
MATGLLILCIDNGTRMSEYLLGQDKRYLAEIKLGESTNTDDAEGEVIATAAVPVLPPEQLQSLQAQFSGDIEQVPPQFSAIKKDGQRAYALARQGETIDLAARTVTVHSLVLRQLGADALQAEVHCGSGTYIRSLARDIGRQIGCGAHLTALRRTSIGGFDLAQAKTYEQLDAADATARASYLLSIDRAIEAFASVTLSEAAAIRMMMGQAVAAPAGLSGERARVYDVRGRFIAIASIEANWLKPSKVFAQPGHVDSGVL